MRKIHTSILIQAPKEKVWDVMLADATYREWTSVFMPGSYYKGSWEQGSKILFLGPGEKGEGGLFSTIEESRPHEFISIKHLGLVKDGVEDTTPSVWAGAHENYTFIDKDGGTELVIDLDVAEEEATVMGEMWNKALLKIKELAEK